MMNEADEIEMLREKRRLEIQQQLEQQASQQAEIDVQEQMEEEAKEALDSAMRTILTSQAKTRLSTVELAHPQLALTVKQHLVSLVDSKRITPPLDDSTLKRILSSLSSMKRETKITHR